MKYSRKHSIYVLKLNIKQWEFWLVWSDYKLKVKRKSMQFKSSLCSFDCWISLILAYFSCLSIQIYLHLNLILIIKRIYWNVICMCKNVNCLIICYFQEIIFYLKFIVHRIITNVWMQHLDIYRESIIYLMICFSNSVITAF